MAYMTAEEQREQYRASCEYSRKGKTITNLKTNEAVTHPSINEAKRRIRALEGRSYTISHND